MPQPVLTIDAAPTLHIDLRPVGVVHSPVADLIEMPPEGLPATIEVFPEYASGLFRLESNTHITVVGWLDRARRDTLETVRPNGRGDPRRRGVFACRCQARPNPIGVTSTRLLRIEGHQLHVAPLDMIDGTPVLDIKPYSASFDCMFSARSSRDVSPTQDHPSQRDQRLMLREAVNFHGELCRGVALGVKMLSHMRMVFSAAQKDPEVVVLLGQDGCLCDALQGLCGATFGNGRLRLSGDHRSGFLFRGRELLFSPKAHYSAPPEDLLEMAVDQLFEVEETGGEDRP
ncbi:MAG: tRNA (N6-threonylcarbamoyladenosine(37)-N6)-methyltransferase TrmO [Chloroflexota bacterium]